MAWVCVAIGVAGLLGWALAVPALTSVVPGLASMKANTAICFILLGVALLLRVRIPHSPGTVRLVQWVVLPVVLLAALSLAEYVTGHAFGVDTLLFGPSQRAGNMTFPGRMAPGTAMSFLVLSTVIALLDRDVVDLLAVVPAALGVVGTAGAVDALVWPGAVTSYSSMAMQTGIGVTLLTVAASLSRPKRGYAGLLRDATPTGSLARGLLIGAFAVPLGIGWVLYDFARENLISAPSYAGLTIIVTILVLAVLGQFLTIRLHRAESARATADARFFELFDSAPVGLFRSLPDGTILDGNPALVRILGLPDRAELLAHNARDFYVDGADRDRFVEQLVSSGTVAGMEFRFQHGDGSIRWVESHAHAVRNPDGTMNHLTGSFIDITARKRAEAQFLAAQRMEAVGQLAGGVAHDFNNLLTVLHTTAEFLLEETPPGDQRRADVEEILRTTKRASALTRQLLAFSRRQVFETRVLNLNDVVAGMDSLLRRIIGDDVRLVTVRAGDLGNVRADPAQVEQVIANLAVNARDAMPEGGTLTIETANVTLDARQAHGQLDVTPGDYVSLAVSDTGHGMPADVAAHVFEPFFTTKGVGKGTGLGLATVYGIVRQSGGSVRLDTAEGAGATFKLYLPRVAEAVEAEEAATARRTAPRAKSGETVLVVDDNRDVRGSTARILRTLGYVVVEASGPEGWEEASRGHGGIIHLLVTDVVMAGLSGPELAERFRARHPDACVLFTSGYADRGMASGSGLPAGAAFIQKPFTVDGLGRKVHEVLHGG